MQFSVAESEFGQGVAANSPTSFPSLNELRLPPLSHLDRP
ncbi:hypothetical protein LINPERPRIM_LOCUS25173 [Linum perenne]